MLDYLKESAGYFGWFVVCCLAFFLPLVVWAVGRKRLRGVWWGILVLYFSLALWFFLAGSDPYEFHNYSMLVSFFLFTPYLFLSPLLSLQALSRHLNHLGLWLAAFFLSGLTGLIAFAAHNSFEWTMPQGRRFHHLNEYDGKHPPTSLRVGMESALVIFALFACFIIIGNKRKKRLEKLRRS